MITLLFVTGCQRTGGHATEPSVRAKQAGDEAIEGQSLYGFYAPEGSWRWTAGRFGVMLPIAPDADRRPATLRVKLYIPDEEIRSLGPMTLFVTLDCEELTPETYGSGGEHILERQLPEQALLTNLLPVSFRFDKAVEPTSQESRQLGAVVTSLRLVVK